MENRNDILKELKEIAPALSKIEKKSFDEVPADFFNSFPEAMMKKVREQELAQIAPTLSQQKKVNEFEVPADYFNAFPQQMLTKVSSTSQGAASKPQWMEALNAVLEKVAGIFFKPKYAFAFAGTVSMVIIASMFFMKTEQAPCAKGDLLCCLEKVSDEELDAYFLANPDDFQKSILDVSTEDALYDI